MLFRSKVLTGWERAPEGKLPAIEEAVIERLVERVFERLTEAQSDLPARPTRTLPAASKATARQVSAGPYRA